MKFLAACLDRLPSESAGYLDILLPNIHTLKILLERLRDGSSVECPKPLVEALLRQPNVLGLITSAKARAH